MQIWQKRIGSLSHHGVAVLHRWELVAMGLGIKPTMLLLRAQDYDVETLKRLFPGIEFGPAIDTLEIISAKTEDKQMYDQREKAQRDYKWALASVREEGREEGEQIGLEKGEIIGMIRMLQEVLGDVPTEQDELKTISLDALSSQLVELRRRIRDRQA